MTRTKGWYIANAIRVGTALCIAYMLGYHIWQ